MQHRLLVARWCDLKKCPCNWVLMELGQLFRRQFGSLLLLMGIDSGFIGPAAGKRLGTSNCHTTLRLQLLKFGNIDCTPYRIRFSRREANGISLLIDPSTTPTNPADTKCLTDGLRPRETRSTRAHLIKTSQQLSRCGRVNCQPCAKRDDRRKVDWRGHGGLRYQCFGPFMDAVSTDYAIEYKRVLCDKRLCSLLGGENAQSPLG